MSLFITILVIIVCLFLMLIILVQNPKGGLDSAFSTNSQIGGVHETTNFLEKSTWTLGIVIVCLSVLSSFFINSGNSSEEIINSSKIEEKVLEKSNELPVTPSTQIPNQEASKKPVQNSQSSTKGGKVNKK